MDSNIDTIEPRFFVRALYDYTAEDTGSLSFQQHDIIEVLTRLDTGWWDGVMISNNERGWFPCTWCVPITNGAAQSTDQNGGPLYDDLGDESEGEYDMALDLDVGYHENVVGGLDGVDGARRGQDTADQDALWLPQTTADGQIYFFNSYTGEMRSNLEPVSGIGTFGLDFTRDADYDDSASDMDGMTGSRSSLHRKRGSYVSNGVSPATSLESLTLAASTRDSSSSNLSLLQQATTPRPPTATSFMGTASWTRTQKMSQKLFGGAAGVPLTWSRILEDIKRSIERYRQAINDDDRGDFVRRAEDISDHLRLMLAAGSGTTDDHSGKASIISSNPMLYRRYLEMMKSFPKLILSSHIAAADWSPHEARHKCLLEAEAVLNEVYGYIDVARQQRGEEIPRLFPGFMDNQHAGGSWRNNNRLSMQSTSDMSTGRQSEESFADSASALDQALLAKVEDLRHQMASGIRALLEQLVFEGPMIDVHTHLILSDNVCSACAKVLSSCKPWLATIESIDLLPVSSVRAGEKELLEFASKKQRSYTLIGDIVTSCQTVAAPLADEWTSHNVVPLDVRLARVRTAVEQLDKNAFELAGSLKRLLDNVPPASNEKRRSSRMSTSSKAAPGTMLSNISHAATQADGKKSDPLRKNLRKYFGVGDEEEDPPEETKNETNERPPSKRESQEQPKYLQLEHESEVLYDAKATTATIRGGTLIGLVEQLTRHDKYDPVFNNTFLLTYQSFTTAVELFELLVKRWNVQPISGLTQEEYAIWVERKQTPIRFRIVNVLKSWLDTYWMEGTDKESMELIQQIHRFVRKTVQASGLAGAKPLLVVIEQRLSGEEVNSKKLVANSNVEAPTPILPKSLNKKNARIIDFDPLELARQLTIMESNLYRKIKPQECLNKKWSIKGNFPNGQVPAPNIKALILHANRVTNWVVFMILTQAKLKERTNVIKYFISVADRCLYMGNFSTVTSIISAFGTAPIARLSRTWLQVHKASSVQLERIRKLMSTTKNFSEYREALHRANPPCIPFFGVYLTDLTFIEDGIPATIKKSDLINFAKRAKTAEVIREIQTYQNVAYPFKTVPELLEMMIPVINESPDVSDQDTYDLSLRLEPREREDEKIARLLSESGFL